MAAVAALGPATVVPTAQAAPGQAAERVLVTNHTLFLGNPASWVVHDVHAGERGRSEFRPQVR